jgi:hypothetical protein
LSLLFFDHSSDWTLKDMYFVVGRHLDASEVDDLLPICCCWCWLLLVAASSLRLALSSQIPIQAILIWFAIHRMASIALHPSVSQWQIFCIPCVVVTFK